MSVCNLSYILADRKRAKWLLKTEHSILPLYMLCYTPQGYYWFFISTESKLCCSYTALSHKYRSTNQYVLLFTALSGSTQESSSLVDWKQISKISALNFNSYSKSIKFLIYREELRVSMSEILLDTDFLSTSEDIEILSILYRCSNAF